MAVAGFVLSIIALVLAWVPLMGWVVWPTAILGMIFGPIGISKSKTLGSGKGLGIAALLISIIAIINKVISLIIAAAAFAAAIEGISSL